MKKYKGNLGSLTYPKLHQNFRNFNKRAGIWHDHLPIVTQYFDGDDIRGLGMWTSLLGSFTANELFFTLATPNWLPAAVPLEHRKVSGTYFGGNYLVTHAQ